MAKTRVKVIDDSKPEAEEVKKPTKQAQGPQRDEFVEKLKAELGIEEEVKPVIPAEAGIQKIDSGSESGMTKKAPRDDKQAKPKAGKEKPRSKKYKEAAALVDKNVTYPLNEAVELAKKVSYSKYDGTFELHVNTNSKNIRGLVSLPYASGKKVRIMAFGKGAAESGADIVGDEAALAEIEKGKINFDVLITTPEMMPRISRLAKVLGPRGLMPNPKNGTIAENLEKAVSEIQSGKLEYKTESNKMTMHVSLGKISQPSEELSQNVKVLLTTIGKSKIKKAVLSPTLGPGVKLDLASI